MKYLLTVFFTVSALGLFANGSQEDDSMMMSDDSMMMEEDAVMSEDDTMMAEDESMMMSSGMGGMEEFTSLKDAQMYAKEGPAVLFFNATWCPTCKTAMRQFKSNADNFGDIKLFIVDYDNSSDLQERYGVSYQHTFVQVDEDGDELAKWNGGEFDELLNKVKR